MTATVTEVNYLDGVTSNVQEQIDGVAVVETAEGSVTNTAVNSTGTTNTVSFGKTFSTAPSVMLTLGATYPHFVTVSVGTITTTNFQYTVYQSSGTTKSVTVKWLAVEV